MKYLIRKKKPKCYHVFVGSDTLCRLYSTGGLSKKKYVLSSTPGDLPVCQLCGAVMKLTEGDDGSIESAPLSEKKKELD